MSWVKAIPCGEVQNGPAVFKHPPKQVAVFQVAGNIYAVDNRCPHEGYPLAEGRVDDNCVLTCNWHNWKFQLSDGACVLGSDDVRSYGTKVEDGYVWIDLTDPPLEVLQHQVLRGLEAAFRDQEFDRICRELSRLYFYGLDPTVAVRQAIAWSYDRFEFGFVHAYAATADWLELARHFEGQWEPQLICLAESIDHMAHDALRHPPYPFPDIGEPFAAEGFTTAVEAQAHDRAVGMVVQGLAEGLHWADMQAPFANAALVSRDFQMS
jgi:nitrite reductase/ring-hydroxylating ferredoxin subunit